MSSSSSSPISTNLNFDDVFNDLIQEHPTISLQEHKRDLDNLDKAIFFL